MNTGPSPLEVGGAEADEFNFGLSERGARRLCRTWCDPRELDRDKAVRVVEQLMVDLVEQGRTDVEIARMLLREDAKSYREVAKALRFHHDRGMKDIAPVTARTVGVRFGQIRNRFIGRYRELARESGVDRTEPTPYIAAPDSPEGLAPRVSHRRKQLRHMTPQEMLGLEPEETVDREVYVRVVREVSGAARSPKLGAVIARYFLAEPILSQTQGRRDDPQIAAEDVTGLPPAQQDIAAAVGLRPAAVSDVLRTARARLTRCYAGETGRRSNPGR